MNSKTLLNKVVIKSTFDKELSESILKFVFAEIQKIIKERKHLTILELGDFSIVHRKMQLRGDEDGHAEVLLPPKDKIVFKPSENLINRLKNDD